MLSSKAKHRAQKVYSLLFAIVLLDSLISYEVRNLTGVTIPINAALPGYVVVAGLLIGFSYVRPPVRTLVWLALIASGFCVGIANGAIPMWSTLRQVVTALSAFAIGYAAVQWQEGDASFGKWCLAIGGLYVVVCTLALLGVAPDMFPLFIDTGNRHGVTVHRPSITTDQNFQIYYLFPCALTLATRFSGVTYAASGIASVAALFVLAQLETRSGTLIMAACVGMSMLVSMSNPGFGRLKIILAWVVCAVLVALEWEAILSLAHGLIERFSNDAFETFWGRVYSATYLFERINQPSWWIPQGNGDFIRRTGNIPHFTPTAMFLEGGLLSLVAWFALFAAPLTRLVLKMVRGRLDSLGSIVAIGGIGAFTASLSLNTPYFEQAWLWGGAVLAASIRANVTQGAHLSPNPKITIGLGA